MDKDKEKQEKYTKDVAIASLMPYAVIFLLIPLVFLLKIFVNDTAAIVAMVCGAIFAFHKGAVRCPNCGFRLKNLANISFFRGRCIRCGFEFEKHWKKK